MKKKDILTERICNSIANVLNEMAFINSKILAKYAEVDIFSNDYYIVKNEEGLYNIVDRDGKQLSKRWFDEIKKHDDKINVKVSEENGKATTMKDISITSFKALGNVVLPSLIKMKDVQFLPRIRKVKTNDKVLSIIATVTYKSVELLIDVDGNLYDVDGNAYVGKDTTSADKGYQERREILDRKGKNGKEFYGGIIEYMKHRWTPRNKYTAENIKNDVEPILSFSECDMRANYKYSGKPISVSLAEKIIYNVLSKDRERYYCDILSLNIKYFDEYDNYGYMDVSYKGRLHTENNYGQGAQDLEGMINVIKNGCIELWERVNEDDTECLSTLFQVLDGKLYINVAYADYIDKV